MEPLYSIEEAARRLGGISKWTLFAWLSQGRLQRTKVGARTMIRQSELEKVINDGGKSPAPTRSRSADAAGGDQLNGRGESRNPLPHSARVVGTAGVEERARCLFLMRSNKPSEPR
jgi:excisionase family DNA binding protein